MAAGFLNECGPTDEELRAIEKDPDYLETIAMTDDELAEELAAAGITPERFEAILEKLRRVWN